MQASSRLSDHPRVRRPLRRAVAAGAVALSLTVAFTACGGDDDAAVTLPGEPSGEFDDATIIGEELADAEAIAESDGWQLRVIRIDGEDLMATTDFVSNRVNIATVDDIVTEVISIG